jgi:acetyltransferase-like isoleucine patch superfamily enzyme
VTRVIDNVLRRFSYALAGFRDIATLPIFYMRSPLGTVLRYRYYKKRLKHLGKNVILDIGVHIINPEFVSIGDNSWIDKYVILIAGSPFEGERKIFKRNNDHYRFARGELHIGKRCHIAPYTLISGMGGVSIGNNVGVAGGSQIYSFSHHYRNIENKADLTLYKFTPMAEQWEQALIESPVVMEDNVAVSLNNIILPGVTIHKNSWVGPGMVVREDIPPNTIVVLEQEAKMKERRIQQTENDILKE